MPVSVDIPDEMKRLIDRSVENGLYNSRSELIREAIRNYLESEGLVERKKLSADAIESIRNARENDDHETLEQVKKELGLQ